MAAARAALEIVRREPERRQALLRRATAFRHALAAQGWDTGRSVSQIIPLIVGTPHSALRIAAELRMRGLFVPAIRPPTVPEGEACLRVSLTWGHSDEMIERLIEALRETGGRESGVRSAGGGRGPGTKG
jgi:8-amino-7-oxononanoate synthase